MPLGYDSSVASLAAAVILSCFAANGQTAIKPTIPVNYDEAQVGTYTLPDPLVLASGNRVRDAKTWYEDRRPEILRLFETNMHGRSPGRPDGITFDVFDKGTSALAGKAVRKQVTVYFFADKAG